MKLLIITQIVDNKDPILGFFHRWIEEFARNCDSVVVICLKEGEHHLPSNVRVLSLGKERGTSRVTKLLRLYRYILFNRKQYSHVFVHMNHEYVLLAGLLFKILRKRVGLWYVHKSVTTRLKIAVSLCDVVFTASKESFRYTTGKLRIIGHGIDTAFFTPEGKVKRSGKAFRLLSAGRISFAKHHDLLIRALSGLPESFNLSIAGAPVTDMDRGYENKLRTLVQQMRLTKQVTFFGAMDQSGIREQYHRADAFVHASTTGSYDKVVLEALACGLPVVTSSEAFLDRTLPVTVVEHTEQGFREGIEAVEKAQIDPTMLHNSVALKHSIENCIKMILSSYPV